MPQRYDGLRTHYWVVVQLYSNKTLAAIRSTFLNGTQYGRHIVGDSKTIVVVGHRKGFAFYYPDEPRF